MKRALTLVMSLILISGFVFSSFAEPVNSETAMEVGKVHLEIQENFWKAETASVTQAAQEYSILDSRELKVDGKVLAYIFDLSPEGCIVISPDTDITPVIAYSYDGKFSMEDTPGNVLHHLVRWDMENRLEALPITSEELKEENNALWANYLASEDTFIQQLASSDVYGPGLETTWYQYDGYEGYCPIDPVTGGRSVVGCVATAFAQIVNYWEYPSSLTFSDADDYTSNAGTARAVRIDDDHNLRDFPSFNELNQMLADIRYHAGNINTADTETQSDIAALCFGCGVIVEMDYSSGGSGSPDYIDQHLLSDRFGYASAELVDADQGNFYDLLEANMKSDPLQPAELGIFSYFGGHDIVVDGYRDVWDGVEPPNGFYHLNFGWKDNPDSVNQSWYSLPGGIPAGFSIIDAAALNIKPPENDPPVAYNQSVETDADSPVAITLTGSDPDGDPLTYSVTSGPTNGLLTGTPPNLTYTPNPGFDGDDSFTFVVNDGIVDSNTATVNITVYPTELTFVASTYDVLSTALAFEFTVPMLSRVKCFDWIGMEVNNSGEWDFVLSNDRGLMAKIAPADPRKIVIDINRDHVASVNLAVAALIQHEIVDLMLEAGTFTAVNGQKNGPVMGTVRIQMITNGYTLGKVGDVTGDDGISPLDAALILQDSAGVPEDEVYPIFATAEEISNLLAALGHPHDLMLSTADVSGNGVVTAFDAAQALRVSIGLAPVPMAPGISGAPKKVALKVSSFDNQKLTVTIDLNDVANVYSADMVLTYDPQSLTIADVSGTVATAEWLTAHRTEPGRLRISMAGASQPVANGSLVTISFDVDGSRDAIEKLNIADFRLNGGQLKATIENLPKLFALLQNYPNPFNPETWIPYRLSEAGDVSITIYNVNGQMVRQLHLGSKMPGYYVDKSRAAYWDGTNESGEAISSGIYFYQMQAGQNTSVKKMIIVR